jgi:glutathione S-transferase
MTRKITLHSFGDTDRSGKVRWTACELGYEIDEVRIALGDHLGPGYRELNPYAQIPTVIIDGETWIDSTAICILLAEKHPEAGLVPGDPASRREFWQQVHLASATLEMPVVNFFLSMRGILDERWQDLVGKPAGLRVRAFASRLPSDGYLCGEFSIADICAGYVLRVAVQAGLLPYEGFLEQYMDRLRARPAAIESRIFDTLEA